MPVPGPCYIPPVDLRRNATLAGAVVYVVAVAALISSNEVPVDPDVATGLQLRQFVFLARTIPFGETDDSQTRVDGMSDFLSHPLEALAGRTFPSNRDRLRGAAVALVFDARELIPLFIGPAAGTDPIARLLVEWSFDPGVPVSLVQLDSIRASGLDPHLVDPLVAALAESSGLVTHAASAREAASERWGRTLFIGAFLGLLMFGIMIAGAILWFRVRRMDNAAPPGEPMKLGSALPLIRVFVYFLAVFLTVGALAPSLFPGDGLLSLPTLVVLTYVITGSFGLWLVKKVGGLSPDEDWLKVLGLRGAFNRERLSRSALWALAAYCMIWPAMLGTSILSSGLFGDGGGVFENPMAVFLVTESDAGTTLLMLLSVSILAPLFEEPLFRGFLYGRLRRHMNPFPAAAVSGLVFGAAHMSLENLLPLAAIGFTLALTYERSRDLATPMIAHGAWNLVEAGMLLAVFR